MTGKKKILLIHRYFWPDTPPYAVMLREMAKGLVDAGFDVTVFSSQPSYKLNLNIPKQAYDEDINGFKVVRNRLQMGSRKNIFTRVVDILSFCVGLFFYLMKSKHDICMIATTPPIVGGLVLRLACQLKGTPYMYHCQDIYPEVALVSNSMQEGWLYRFLQRIDLKTCESAMATIVLSDDMKQSMLHRGYQNTDNLMVINNFELKSDMPEKSDVIDMDNRFFNVVFAGNIGRFQGLDTVVDAIKKLPIDSKVRFYFVGEGAALKGIKEQLVSCIGSTVFFMGHQPISVTRRFLAKASLCLVTLQKDIIKYAFPSKTMTYLCEGKPILVMAEESSALANMVKEYNLGFVVSPGNAQAMADTILQASTNSEENKQQSMCAKQFALENFSTTHVVQKWVNLFRQTLQTENK